jgi:hypothetical protein
VTLPARLRASPLGVKLALLSALVTAAVVAVTFLALRASAGSDVRQAFIAELEASQRGLQQLQDRDLRLLLATSSVVSTSAALRRAPDGAETAPACRREQTARDDSTGSRRLLWSIGVGVVADKRVACSPR